MSNEQIKSKHEVLVETMLKLENAEDAYKVARLFYRLGKPLVTDAQYDLLHKEMLRRGHPLTAQLYDEDEVPVESMRKFGINVEKVLTLVNELEKIENNKVYAKWKTVLESEVSHSITPIETHAEAWEWFQRVKGDLIFSIKIDGINTKNLVSVGETMKHELSSTRSRGGSGIDITVGVRKMFPNINQEMIEHFKDDHFFVRAECYAPSKGLEELRNKYNKDFKVPRTTGMSVLRVPLRDEDYDKVKLMVFKLTGFNRVSEGLEVARKMGFETVPYKVIDSNKVPKGFEDFKVWIDKILTAFYKVAEMYDISSDGLVVELDDQRLFDDAGEKTGGMYNAGNIALKLGAWEPGIYQSIITKISTIQNQENTSFVAHFEPVITDNGITVSKVNIFNPDIMFKNDLRPTMPIKFEHKSGTMPSLIYEYN